ncbi:MAG TPA: hypothetical protein VKZ84_03185 [Bacteriovoracaceae bacterium]|nr:hypothetical protein [Bacteriovoracaceae bacterium]
MKTSICLFLILSLFSCYAAPPAGWVEMTGPDPIILSWAKVNQGKKLEESPLVMIQKHENSTKWQNALKNIPALSDGCKEVSAKKNGDWNQLYCELNKNVYVYLWKGNATDTEFALQEAKKWLKNNE